MFVVSYYPPYHSGVTEYVKRLAEGLAARGHDATVLTSRHIPTLPSDETLNGVRVIRLPVLFKVSKGVFKPALLPTLRRMCQDYDIVNIHLPLPEVGACALLLKKRNLILTYHCDLELHKGLPEKLIEKIYYLSLNFALPRSERIIVNDLDYAMHSKIRSYKEKIVEIHPPITAYQRTDPAGFKNKYGLKQDDIIIGFLGRLVYEKGLEYLIKAVPLVLAELPKARFIIAGEGEDVAGGKKHSVKDELIKMSKPYGDRVLFTGFLPQSEIPAFYSACDVFVLPSIAPLESFGMVQVEAMLCGTPVVATDMPGVRTPVIKTKMGILVPPKDEESLAIAITTIINERNRYIRPTGHICLHFSIDNTIESYEKIFINSAQKQSR